MGWGGAKGYSKISGSSAGGKAAGKPYGKAGGWGKGAGGGGGRGGSKPTDDPGFVQLSEGARLKGTNNMSYVVEAYVASGTFSRVFRVRQEDAAAGAGGPKRRWAPKSEGRSFAAKIMRATDAYIQYSSDARKEGEILQQLEKIQRDRGKDVLTMQCFDSFSCADETGEEYWCLILEWLDASLFDAVRANGNRGLHLSMVRILLRQLLEQLQVLQELQCTHTDIKHKNCCLADNSYYLAAGEAGARPAVILANPLAKFIDYGNAVFEGDAKTHPIHTKQFRAPEVLLNTKQGWGPPSDTWTLGITAAYLVSGQLIFNSHEPPQLVRGMVEALGPFPADLLESARDQRLRRVAEDAAEAAREPTLAARKRSSAIAPRKTRS